MRRAPSSPVSSRPGVSIITTGPRGRSSIAFKTGSVVVPFTSDTMARFCPVRALIRLDFPALRLPKIPMWILSADGVLFKLIIVSSRRSLLSCSYLRVRSGSLCGCFPGSASGSPARRRVLFHLGRLKLPDRSAYRRYVWFPEKRSPSDILPASSMR